MIRRFKVVSKTQFDHNFEIGQTVELVQIYSDGVYEVRGKHVFSDVNQDVHPADLEEIFEEGQKK